MSSHHEFSPSRSPSIVLITTDTQARNMVCAYGDRPAVETPNLDRFAERATLFENAYCASPVCTPARGSWYTGLHPSRHGAWTNDLTLHRGETTLAERLRTAAYRCVHLGKWHLDGGGYNGHGRPDGGFEPPWFDISNFHQAHPQEGPNRFGAWNRGLDDIEYCFAHNVADRAIDVMREPGDHPLFLAVEFDEPHGPYICPPPWRGRFAYDAIDRPATMNDDLAGKPELQRQYAAFLRGGRENPDDLPAYYRLYHDCNSYVDHEIGRVLEAIDQHMPADTVVVFTSDHGDHHGAFGLCAKGPTMYESTCGVPLLIRTPDGRPGGRTASLASGVDLAPTLLDYAGAPPLAGAGHTGVSLRPVLRGEAASVRDHVIMEYHRFGLGIDAVDGLYPIRCIRTDRWKLSLNLFDRDELYDLADDADERENRIDDPACGAVRDQLHDRLLAWQDRTKDPFRCPQWKRRPWRSDATHTFQGLFTTGYKDDWPDPQHDFHAIPHDLTEPTDPTEKGRNAS